MKIIKSFFTLFLLTSCASKTTVNCYNENTSRNLYKYLPNNITLYSNKKIINVSIDDGIITKSGDNNYFISSLSKDMSTITINLKKETKQIHFRNKEIPQADLSLGGVSFKDGDSIHKSIFTRPDALIKPLIFTDLVCNDWDVKLESITIIRIDKDKNTSIEKTSQVRPKLISKAESGDTYIFTDVKVKFLDKILQGKSIYITITD